MGLHAVASRCWRPMAGWEDDSEVCGLRTGGLRRPRGGTAIAAPAATVLTGVGVLIDVWRIVTVQVDSVQRDLSAQIAAVNTRIDNILLAERRPSA